ncbi:crotonase/enoyl-CoA hydratase family protein [Cupriavidus oxalaticus]|jgi:enoyl-CoA hydratase|uniref:Carnitinyl-CoA dehydratase n=1 Tax=Cupriavidus oxalaticus TaxID=96344 RepID=A0A375FZ73_9BURK|nr:crotonase/enoyl-CoA hydratase family protein [Cupriavidus oxalaticus]QEZ46707.1 enoyl-CoA hydratase [Cupriavidus oxalaticus]QRQ88969.1 crotonase/enoyl-CoA hydratase family protein [Cupriavidus oxalaticus]QRQ92705.1 crotonase/enoyl-CoA hydratase family protein [Cupriavidus oxalaticus]WQD81308.1 crotonase/enoyl-CoA hydratase family protein [Cupriavidus oxalaticus]SPC12600.1 Carnitinyl-CoA dehydratase [Cupriavidus oxalaticus]
MSDTLQLETRGNTLLITMNRPQARNAMDFETATALAAAIDQLESRDDLAVAILTGAGGTFCSGMDLKGFLEGKRPSLPGRGFGGLTEKPPRKVLIAAVEGYALAGGFELALACDLIVSSKAAKFGLPEVKRGLVAGAGGLMRLPRRVPYHIAMEYALTGNMLGAEQAHAYGLINRLTEPGEALQGALALADEIGANGPLAVAVSKQIVADSADWSNEEMFERQRPLMAPVFTSADAREGAAAFAEKRKPVWTGK